MYSVDDSYVREASPRVASRIGAEVTLTAFTTAVIVKDQSANLKTDDTELKKQVRWFVGNGGAPLPFLTGDNSAGTWANSSLNASDITGGILNCCGTYGVLMNGSIERPIGGWVKDPIFQQYRAAGQQVMVSLAPGDSNAFPDSSFCWKALARHAAFAEEVLALIEGLGVDGINLEWERGANNSIPCYVQLWSNVSRRMRARGKKLAISMDDSKGVPFNGSSTAWAYETDWLPMVPFADELINMGTYPGRW